MKRSAVYGVGMGVNGRDAAMQATQRALDQLSTTRPVLAMVFASQELNHTDVLSGASSLLADTPLWGFSTSTPFCCGGDQPRSVLVALIAGSDLKAEVVWLPNFAQDSVGTAQQVSEHLRGDVFLPGEILMASDGISGSLSAVANALADLPVNLTGCMGGGDQTLGKTYCFGKNQAGPGALSAAMLGGRFRIGVGVAHGWLDLGVFFKATSSKDVWLQTLDSSPAVDMYARYFGFSAREWAFPPLNTMARLYPLGMERLIEQPQRHSDTGPIAAVGLPTGMLTPPGQTTGSLSTGTINVQPAPQPFSESELKNLLLRSVLRVEVDGSLRMSAPVPEGAVVHLMHGDANACMAAATRAAEQAVEALGGARPLIALVFADASWEMLLESHPVRFTSAIKNVIGNVPLVGGYTFGQLARADIANPPILHNQNLLVAIIGESET